MSHSKSLFGSTALALLAVALAVPVVGWCQCLLLLENCASKHDWRLSRLSSELTNEALSSTATAVARDSGLYTKKNPEKGPE